MLDELLDETRIGYMYVSVELKGILKGAGRHTGSKKVRFSSVLEQRRVFFYYNSKCSVSFATISTSDNAPMA